MKEFDERTIWTSDQIPLMASYNRGLLIMAYSFRIIYIPAHTTHVDNCFYLMCRKNASFCVGCSLHEF